MHGHIGRREGRKEGEKGRKADKRKEEREVEKGRKGKLYENLFPGPSLSIFMLYFLSP